MSATTVAIPLSPPSPPRTSSSSHARTRVVAVVIVVTLAVITANAVLYDTDSWHVSLQIAAAPSTPDDSSSATDASGRVVATARRRTEATVATTATAPTCPTTEAPTAAPNTTSADHWWPSALRNIDSVQLPADLRATVPPISITEAEKCELTFGGEFIARARQTSEHVEMCAASTDEKTKKDDKRSKFSCLQSPGFCRVSHVRWGEDGLLHTRGCGGVAARVLPEIGRRNWADSGVPVVLEKLIAPRPQGSTGESWGDDECPTWVEEPAFFTLSERREKMGNVAHELNMMHSIFVSRLAIGLNDTDLNIRIYLLDSKEYRTFEWWKGFAKDGAQLAAINITKGTCFRNVVIPVSSGDSILWDNAGRGPDFFWAASPCTSVSLLRRFQVMLKRSVGVLPFHSKPVEPNDRIRVTFVSRKGENRHLPGETAYVTWLTTNGVQARVVQLSALSSFAEQADVFATSDVIVAAHGAGLTHVVHMRRGAVVLELTWPLGSYANYFRNLAKAMDVHYFVLPAIGAPRDYDSGKALAEFDVPSERLSHYLMAAVSVAASIDGRDTGRMLPMWAVAFSSFVALLKT